MEDKENRLWILGRQLVLDVLLVLGQQLGVKLHVARLVDSVDVAEACSNREVRTDWLQGLVDVIDVFWLCVEGCVVYALIVDAVFLATSDADFLWIMIRAASHFGNGRTYHL